LNAGYTRRWKNDVRLLLHPSPSFESTKVILYKFRAEGFNLFSTEKLLSSYRGSLVRTFVLPGTASPSVGKVKVEDKVLIAWLLARKETIFIVDIHKDLYQEQGDAAFFVVLSSAN
jgi:hypothetical protein